jgi:hypothetical protein
LVAVLLLAGCGGGSSSTSSSSAPASTEASKEFNDPQGVKEPITTFGKEAGEAERGAASSALAESLTARQEADFAKQCATLGKRGLESVFGEGKKAPDPANCKAELEKVAQPLSSTKEVRKDTLEGEIAALRIEGDQAFALYHGSDGKDWAMPMEEEKGSWRVGGILAIELPTKKSKPSAPKSGSGNGKKQGA